MKNTTIKELTELKRYKQKSMDNDNIPLLPPVLQKQNRMIIIDNVYYEEEIADISDDETVELITSNINTSLNIQNVAKIQIVRWRQKPMLIHFIQTLR